MQAEANTAVVQKLCEESYEKAFVESKEKKLSAEGFFEVLGDEHRKCWHGHQDILKQIEPKLASELDIDLPKIIHFMKGDRAVHEFPLSCLVDDRKKLHTALVGFVNDLTERRISLSEKFDKN